MFKLLFRVRFGSRWLLAGVRTSGRPFHAGVQRFGITDYTLRVFWFELCLSELPFWGALFFTRQGKILKREKQR